MSESLIEWTREQQGLFETSIVGSDGTLADYNSPSHTIIRGIIGEAAEVLEALTAGDEEAAHEELADVFIFFCTVLNHVGISNEQLELLVKTKMMINFDKYYSDGLEHLTVREIMAARKAEWNANGKQRASITSCPEPFGTGVGQVGGGVD